MPRGLEQIPWLYDAMMCTQPRLDRWRRELVEDAAGCVLEVGCGTGLTLRHYPARAEVIGLDPALDMLLKARKRSATTPLVGGSAEALPFPAGSFDSVVSSLVFCSVPDPRLGLAELRRVLKPDGRLLMLEHVQARSRFAAWLLDGIQPIWTRLAGGCHPNRHTVELVEESGFRIDRESLCSRGLFRRFVAQPR